MHVVELIKRRFQLREQPANPLKQCLSLSTRPGLWKPFKQAANVLGIPLNGPLQHALKNGVFCREEAFHHGEK